MSEEEVVEYRTGMVGVKQASAITGYSVKYLYKLTCQKRIRHYKPQSGRIFFKVQDLEDFMCRGVVLADYDIEKQAIERLQEMQSKKHSNGKEKKNNRKGNP